MSTRGHDADAIVVGAGLAGLAAARVLCDAGRDVAVMSNIAPTYAPKGRHLIVAALPGVIDGDLEAMAREQLSGWWGEQVDEWGHLATYRIAHGQPDQSPPFHPKQPVALGDGLFVCGDHRDTASIQGALYSGRRCGEAALSALSAAPTDR